VKRKLMNIIRSILNELIHLFKTLFKFLLNRCNLGLILEQFDDLRVLLHLSHHLLLFLDIKDRFSLASRHLYSRRSRVFFGGEVSGDRTETVSLN